MEKIISIKEIEDFKIESVSSLEGKNGVRLGMAQMISGIFGGDSMDGYEIVTDEHTYRVLIDNGQSCCEDWGYLSSEDDLDKFLGAKLKDIKFTDTALNQKKVSDTCGTYGFDSGGIIFVDFETTNGVLQLAVYNGHNGYYGHGILVTKDMEILLNETI